jgi:hypothetical protein
MITTMLFDNELSKSGTWKGAMKFNGIRTAMIRCSNNHIDSLSYHTIADDGAVSPSFVCAHLGCNFHEYIKLDGWKPSAI